MQASRYDSKKMVIDMNSDENSTHQRSRKKTGWMRCSDIQRGTEHRDGVYS